MAEIINIGKTLEGIELFMRKCDQPTYRVAPAPSLEDSILRLRLIREELLEAYRALSVFDNKETLDGMADVIYVGGGGILLFQGEFHHPHDEMEYQSEEAINFNNVTSLKDQYVELIYATSKAQADAEMMYHISLEEVRNSVYELSMRALDLVICHAAHGNIPLQDFIDEVQRSNMTKLPVVSRDDAGNVTEYGSAIKDKGGKVLKPETFEPVDFDTVMDKFGI